MPGMVLRHKMLLHDTVFLGASGHRLAVSHSTRCYSLVVGNQWINRYGEIPRSLAWLTKSCRTTTSRFHLRHGERGLCEPVYRFGQKHKRAFLFNIDSQMILMFRISRASVAPLQTLFLLVAANR